MRFKGQIRRDNERQCFTLAFPHDLKPEAFTAWMRSVAGDLSRRSASGGLGRESIVFETWANSRGITHRLHLPTDAADFMAAQLRTHVPGISVTPDDSRPSSTWSAALEIGMSHPSRRLQTDTVDQVAAGVLSSLQGLHGDEVVMMQWVIAPMDVKKSRKVSTVPDEFSILKALSGASVIGTDELNERRKKLEEPNVMGIGRVMARAQFERADNLIRRVESAMKASDSQRTYLKRLHVHPADASRNGSEAVTPSHFPAQLSLSELAGVVGWPHGSPVVAGLSVGTSRHLPSTDAIPRDGRVLGMSNFPGDNRPIAIAREECLRHVHVIGPTGSGKTTLLANNMGKEMADGYGVIMIESKGDLFREAKKLVPPHRIDDLIIVNASDTDMPVGFNLLEQGSPAVVIDQLAELFQSLYGDNKGVWMRELLYYGLSTLAEHKGMTFIDVAPLITPNSPEEVAWSNELRRSVKDTEVREFWRRWESLSKSDQERNSAPLHNRIWQLASRPELRHIIGQSQSSFYMDDVIRQNKILLVNLQGVAPEAASIAGTLIMNAIWNSVRRVRGARENFLYLDEFQDFIRLPVGADDMLAKARGFGLGLTLAHQYLGQLPDDIKRAVMANARSKIVFTVEEIEDARTFAKAFGTTTFGEQDFLHLPRHNVVAKISNSQSSSPVTMQTLPPHPPTGAEQQAVERSRERYGRRAEDVRLEITERRKSEAKSSAKPLPIGIREWGT